MKQALCVLQRQVDVLSEALQNLEVGCTEFGSLDQEQVHEQFIDTWPGPPRLNKIRNRAPVSAPPRPPRGGTLHVVFDFETTGIGKTKDVRITQVGAQALRDDLTVSSTFTRFVNPRKAISEGAAQLTGIRDEVVCDLPDWSKVGKDFAYWVQGALVDSGADDVTLIAHNGKVYDARILVFENARNGLLTPTSWFHCDSIPVFKALFPGHKSYALGKLYSEKFSKELKDAHTADADANAIRELMLIVDTDQVHAAIARNRESFSSVAKRCFK